MDSLTIQVDKTEYSKYDIEKSIVNVYLTFQNANKGDNVSISLNRIDGYGEISTQQITLAESQTSQTITFDLNNITDSEGYSLCRQGYYAIKAVSGSITANSQTFWIGVVTAEELKNRWCYGIPLSASAIIGPVMQPQQITGVKIKSVQSTHKKGIFLLSYTNKSLSWDNGNPVPIKQGIIQDYILVSSSMVDYITVTVNPPLLPTSDVSELIIIDSHEVTDELFRQDLNQAYNEIYQKCYFYPEPTYIATDSESSASGPQTQVTTGWADVRGVPVSYYRMRDFMRWMTVKLPYNRILKVLNLTGWFNGSLTLDVTLDWIVFDKLGGEISLVPNNGSVVSWQFYESAMIQFLMIYETIPNFWHYYILCGLPSLDGEFQIVREAIAKIAALNAISRIGTAYSAGLSSTNTSRDGVSQSKSFGQKYPGQSLADEYKLWLYGDGKQWGNLKRIKDRIIGPQLTVL